METSVKIAPNSSMAVASTSSPTGFTDHIRTRFESIQRQPELASELTCFHPGNELSSIGYIANAYSVHVFRWLNVLSHTQATVGIETANPIPAFSNAYVSAIPVLPAWLKIPMTLRYLFCGLALRFSRSHAKRGIIHAHCASGNGLVAWLSGQPYLIGTYGSEIYGANHRGLAYRWLLKRILQGAERISVGSDESTKILCEQFDIPPERIYFFDLGYDDKNFCPVDQLQRNQLRRDRKLPFDEPIWVVNRRTDPHYRTRDVVDGFLGYCQKGGCGQLVLLCGDHQPDYTKSICDMLKTHSFGDRVTVVERMLSPSEVASWLQLSDFAISVPKTDNFSISTLESMGCGTVPILADLEGYSPLRPCKAVRWMTQFEVSDFAGMFADTESSWSTFHDEDRRECFRFAQDGFSTENAIRNIAAFYLGRPIQGTAWTKRAA